MTRLIDADDLMDWSETVPLTDDGGIDINDLEKKLKSMPTVEPSGLTGWICPICGRGLSPFTSVCPCQGGKGWEITCG
jgi:hypothetical protein